MYRPGLSLNGSASHPEAASEIPDVCQEMLEAGLALLWRGFVYARDLETEGWEFAVNRDVLYQAGLSAIDLRWLNARKYVESAPGTVSSQRQKPCPQEHARFNEKATHFILTNAGAAFALQVFSRGLEPVSHNPSKNEQAAQATGLAGHPVVQSRLVERKPSWDRDRRELRFGESMIKQFRWLAVNQETVLMAFEEDGWPPRIDDPLPRKVNHDPKQRLHDTIKCLNRNHYMRVIRFNGDGTGEGIRWSFLDESVRN